MLNIKHIKLIQFKNYHNSSIRFSPGINCFTGKNGSGKTNLLDALYYLSFTKSFFNPSDSQHVLHGEQFFSIQAAYEKNNLDEQVLLSFYQGKKTIKLNNNEVKKFSDHIGYFPLVMITPNDIFLLHEGSEERRKFLDGLIAQTDKVYLQYLIQYNRVVEQRNKQLKLYAEGAIFDDVLMEAYHQKLGELGQYIYKTRKSFLSDFLTLVNQYYATLSQSAETISVTYKSDLHDADLFSLLRDSLRTDAASQRTTKGIHKDDLEFYIENRMIKKFGSQGQQKSFIIALKLAQYTYLKQATGIKPLLLLDDIFEKLDEYRLRTLMHMIAEETFGQLFITDTHAERVKTVFDTIKHVPVKYFEVNNGEIIEI